MKNPENIEKSYKTLSSIPSFSMQYYAVFHLFLALMNIFAEAMHIFLELMNIFPDIMYIFKKS